MRYQLEVEGAIVDEGDYADIEHDVEAFIAEKAPGTGTWHDDGIDSGGAHCFSNEFHQVAFLYLIEK